MRMIALSTLLVWSIALTACNTVHGAGQDVKSVGRVFSDHPNENK